MVILSNGGSGFPCSRFHVTFHLSVSFYFLKIIFRCCCCKNHHTFEGVLVRKKGAKRKLCLQSLKPPKPANARGDDATELHIR